MVRIYLYENNSFGRRVLSNGPDFHFDMQTNPASVNDVIMEFERLTSLNWNYENSYEGGSCNCCGRRFSLTLPPYLEGTPQDYVKYGYINYYTNDEDDIISKGVPLTLPE